MKCRRGAVLCGWQRERRVGDRGALVDGGGAGAGVAGELLGGPHAVRENDLRDGVGAQAVSDFAFDCLDGAFFEEGADAAITGGVPGGARGGGDEVGIVRSAGANGAEAID